jgi:hypothetical protein
VNATLADDLLLIALDAEARRSPRCDSGVLPYGLAGAVVTELLLRGAVEATPRGLLAAGRPTGDALLDDAAARIGASRRRRGVKGWVHALAGRSAGLRPRLSRRLAAAGVLHEEAHRLLGVLPVRRYAVADQAALAELRARVRAALLGPGTLDARSASLVGLVSACGLVDSLVARGERRAAYGRAAAIRDADLVAQPVRAAIQEAQTAVAAGATAAVVASSAGAAG